MSETKTYKRIDFFKRILGIYLKDEIKHLGNPFEMTVGILPFKRTALLKMTPGRIEKLIKKQQIRLMEDGAEYIVYSKFLKELFKTKGMTINDEEEKRYKKFFLSLAPLCIRQTAKNCKKNLVRGTICIRDSKLDRISEYLMHQLCFDTNNLLICTDEKLRAEAICESFYEETGLLVRLLSFDAARFDACIDVDMANVIFGNDLLVSGLNMGYDLSGYEVQHLDIAAHMPEFDENRVRWEYVYKKIS